ncbi:MAG: transcriptional repressor [Lachnospiraceae bacterium]
MLKNSKQREAIRTVLMETKSHPSAETVYQMLKATYPNISLATVYRNLNLLTELGEITKVSGTTGSDRFDGNVNPHIHFFCTDCNTILDLPSPENDTDQVAIMQETFSGKITGHVTNYYGLCPDCLAKENAQKKII